MSCSSPSPSSWVIVEGFLAGGSVLSASHTTSQSKAPGSAISAARPRISAGDGPARGASFDRRRKSGTLPGSLLVRNSCSGREKQRQRRCRAAALLLVSRVEARASTGAHQTLALDEYPQGARPARCASAWGQE